MPSREPACFVPITVVLELEWVLCGAYQLPRDAVHQEQDELVLARSEGCSALISFDRSLQRSAAELRLSPTVREP